MMRGAERKRACGSPACDQSSASVVEDKEEAAEQLGRRQCAKCLGSLGREAGERGGSGGGYKGGRAAQSFVRARLLGRPAYL
jgi:hypothetical protein